MAKFEAQHIYCDRNGKTMYAADWSNNNVRYAHLATSDNWIAGLNGQRLLYKLPEVEKAHEVVLVNDERSADTLARVGVLATTVPNGLAGWLPIYTEYLRAKHVTLLCEAETAQKESVYQSLYGRAFDVRLITLDVGLAQDLLNGHVNKRSIKSLLSKRSEKDFHDEIQARKKRLTDTGNAEQLVFLHGEKLRYSHSLGRWLIFDSSRWKSDDSNMIHAIAKETVDQIWDEAKHNKNNDAHYRELISFAQRSRSRSSRSNLVELAATEASIQITQDELDRNPYLLNFQNGTLDLISRQFREHDSRDYITKQCPFNYDKAAPVTPLRFRAFLHEVFENRKDLVEYMRNVIAYCFTGATVHQMFWMLYGSGANGKSVLTETLMQLLGDYSARTTAESLMHRDTQSSVPNDIARLQGMRLVVGSEIDDSRRWNESRIKDLTGGDRITARFLHREFFEFTPVLKLLVPTNHKPVVRGTDHGIQRRIKLVPFTVQIQPEKRDPHLRDKLLSEASSIVRWCIDGLPDFLEEYWEPKGISDATKEYFDENDIVGQYLDDSCKLDSTGISRTKKKELYRSFTHFCDENGLRSMTQNKLSILLKERGLEEVKTGGERYWCGIAVRSEN